MENSIHLDRVIFNVVDTDHSTVNNKKGGSDFRREFTT